MDVDTDEGIVRAADRRPELYEGFLLTALLLFLSFFLPSFFVSTAKT